jgi:hypothetical protein
VIINLKKNGIQLNKNDGVLSTGARPNNDDTYQIRISVQIPEADKQIYECFVNHITLNESIVEKWGKVVLVFNILYIFSTNQLLSWLAIMIKIN